jgi:hypothetical protein
MSEAYTYGLIIGAVVAVAIVLYVMDCRSKDQPIEVMDAAKVGGGAGILTGGVLYALGGAEAAEPMVTAVQEMFTGKPSF